MSEVKAEPTKNENEDAYAIFCGETNQITSQKITTQLTGASQAKDLKRVHLLLHSIGGIAGDGIYLYNLFRKLPFEIIVYNMGYVQSAAVTAFLGAKKRVTTANAMFMLHRPFFTLNFANSDKLLATAENLKLDDERTQVILEEHLKLPDEIKEKLKYHDVCISGKDAVKYNIATEIGEFSPKPGSKVYHVLA